MTTKSLLLLVALDHRMERVAAQSIDHNRRTLAFTNRLFVADRCQELFPPDLRDS